MALNVPLEVPETGAVFTFGKSRFADNAPSYFFVKNDPIVDVSCGDEHTIVVCSKGRIFSFGRNAHGELGLGHRSATSRPNCVKGLKSFRTKSVACGGAHSLALSDDGQVFASGKNDEGQLGLNDFEDRDSFEPVQLTSSGEMKQISAGFCHSAGIDEFGNVYLWGSNKCGQLGLEPNGNASVHVPTHLPVQPRCDQVACGYYHTLILTEDGRIWSFGEGDHGKLGYPSSSMNWSRREIKIDVLFQSIDAGGNHSGGISLEGDVYLWGLNDSGQLGVEELPEDDVTRPVKMPFNKKCAFLSLGENHSAVVTEHKELYMFGDNRHGKAVLERNVEMKLDCLYAPTRVNKLNGFEVSKASCGGVHTMVLATRRQPLADLSASSSSDDSVFETPKSVLPPLQRHSSVTMFSPPPNPSPDNRTTVNGNISPSSPTEELQELETDVNGENVDILEESHFQDDVQSPKFSDKSVNCTIDDFLHLEHNQSDCVVIPLNETDVTHNYQKTHSLLEKINSNPPKAQEGPKKDKTERKVSKTCDLL